MLVVMVVLVLSKHVHICCCSGLLQPSVLRCYSWLGLRICQALSRLADDLLLPPSLPRSCGCGDMTSSDIC